jgi:hypothetical protein
VAKLTPAQIDEIVRLREERGMSSTFIASRFNVSTSTVNYQLLRNGVDPWDPERFSGHANAGAFTPDEDARMLELGAAGLSPYQISKVIGRPKTSVLIRILTLEVRAEKRLEAAQ